VFRRCELPRTVKGLIDECADDRQVVREVVVQGCRAGIRPRSPAQKAPYVLVHGAGHGGWVLSARGNAIAAGRLVQGLTADNARAVFVEAAVVETS